jgi:hypothetical protein
MDDRVFDELIHPKHPHHTKKSNSHLRLKFELGGLKWILARYQNVYVEPATFVRCPLWPTDCSPEVPPAWFSGDIFVVGGEGGDDARGGVWFADDAYFFVDPRFGS